MVFGLLLIEKALDCSEESGFVDWFGFVFIASGLEAFLSVVGHGVCGEREDWEGVSVVA